MAPPKKITGYVKLQIVAAKATPANDPTLLTVTDPDGAVISFVKAVLPELK